MQVGKLYQCTVDISFYKIVAAETVYIFLEKIRTFVVVLANGKELKILHLRADRFNKAFYNFGLEPFCKIFGQVAIEYPH